MKRPSYRAAIEWLAFNDEPTLKDAEEIGSLVTTSLVADMFDLDHKVVAVDILRCRAAAEDANARGVERWTWSTAAQERASSITWRRPA
jgi:hypothetical protein